MRNEENGPCKRYREATGGHSFNWIDSALLSLLRHSFFNPIHLTSFHTLTQCEWSVKVNWGWMNSLPARAVPASGALRLLHHSIQSHSISVKFTEMSWLNYIPFIHVAHSGTSFVISFLLSGTFIHYVHSLFTPLIRLQLINYVHLIPIHSIRVLFAPSVLAPFTLHYFHWFIITVNLGNVNMR